MGRYTGPKNKLSRREGVDLFGNGGESLARRLHQPPGTHGRERGNNRRQTEYSIQLREKQKAKRIYGMRERQFQRFFHIAQHKPGMTSDVLLQLLERRLDNVIYRLGWARTRPQARQFVSHGHILVDGKRVDIPSYLVKAHQSITFKSSTKFSTHIREMLAPSEDTPQWLSSVEAEGRVLHIPLPEDINTDINAQLIVEFYSR